MIILIFFSLSISVLVTATSEGWWHMPAVTSLPIKGPDPHVRVIQRLRSLLPITLQTVIFSLLHFLSLLHPLSSLVGTPQHHPYIWQWPLLFTFSFWKTYSLSLSSLFLTLHPLCEFFFPFLCSKLKKKKKSSKSKVIGYKRRVFSFQHKHKKTHTHTKKKKKNTHSLHLLVLWLCFWFSLLLIVVVSFSWGSRRGCRLSPVWVMGLLEICRRRRREQKGISFFYFLLLLLHVLLFSSGGVVLNFVEMMLLLGLGFVWNSWSLWLENVVSGVMECNGKLGEGVGEWVMVNGLKQKLKVVFALS